MSAITIEARGDARDAAAFTRDFAALPSRVRPARALGAVATGASSAFLEADPQAEFWIARDGAGAPLGRVGANVSRGDRTVGFVGFFEVEPPREGGPDAAALLLAAATSWLAVRGARRVVAPVNLSTWFPYRFRVDDDRRAFAWEPQQPAWYAPAFARAGFAEIARYHTDAFAAEPFARAVAPSRARAEAMGYRFRPLTRAPADLEALHRITQRGFAGSYLFEPLPFPLFRALYVPALAAYDARPSRFLVDPRGDDVGFLFAFRDGDALVYKTVALVPEARGKGLSDSLFHVAWEDEAARAGGGVRQVITALVRGGAQSESYTRKASRAWRHEYVLLGRPAADASADGRRDDNDERGGSDGRGA